MSKQDIQTSIDTFVAKERTMIVQQFVGVTKKFLLEKGSVEESEINDLISQLATSLNVTVASTSKSDSKGEKKKRGPTTYNKFIGMAIRKIKAENIIKTNAEMMSKAIEMWKELKDKYSTVDDEVLQTWASEQEAAPVPAPVPEPKVDSDDEEVEEKPKKTTKKVAKQTKVSTKKVAPPPPPPQSDSDEDTDKESEKSEDTDDD